MTSVDVLVHRLRDKGIELAVQGDSIRYRPSNALSETDREALRRNKGAILAVLYRERFAVGVLKAMEPSDPRILNLEAEVEAMGHVLIWSNVLEDLIAFCWTPEDAERVPRGVVAYTADELAMLFPQEAGGPGDNGLKLIHRAKQLGGGSVRSVETSDED